MKLLLVVTILLMASVCMANGQVKIRPSDIPADVQWPHFMSIRISPPWDQQGEWEIRSPETIGSNHGLLFIDHRRPDMLPVTNPSNEPKWHTENDGSLFYACRLDNGVRFAVKMTPGKNDVSIFSTFTNGFREHLNNIGNQYCLIQKGVKGFEDPKAERTFILVNGNWISLANTKPGQPNKGELPFFIVTNTRDQAPLEKVKIDRSWWADEQDNIPLIATVSEDGKHIVGLAFDNSYKIMTNACIPCIHADPKYPDCMRGNTVSIRGKIYFVEGKLDDLLPLFYRDFPEWKNRPAFKRS